MIQKITIAFLLIAAVKIQVQEKTDSSTYNWKKSGNISFLVNQPSFSNLVAVG